MKEKLQILEGQIRKDLPRLMELSEGCYLKNYGSGKMYRVMGREGEICFLQDINDLKSSSLEITESTAINYFEVIGHDIMLNDVLDMFIVKPRDHTNHFKNTTRILEIVNHWDLSKPHLKDQSEELIEFLYNLIEK